MNERSFIRNGARWDDLAAFLAVARAGGLSAAAKDVASSGPTLGRRMRALERALGRELFVRKTHGYDLTDAGCDLLAELEVIADQITRVTERPAPDTLPLVKISAGTWTSLALARHWCDITGTPPDVRLRLMSSEAVLSLSRREVSVAIRNRRPTEQGIAARKLLPNAFAVFAVADAPSSWIVHGVDTPSSRWVRARIGQDVFHEVSHPRLALDMALAGVGQVVLPTFIGDAESGLARRSDPIAELSHDAWLVAHDDDRHLPEVRRVIDRICALRG